MLCLLINLGLNFFTVSAKDVKSIKDYQIIDLSGNSNQNVEFYKHTSKEFKELISKDVNMTETQKLN